MFSSDHKVKVDAKILILASRNASNSVPSLIQALVDNDGPKIGPTYASREVMSKNHRLYRLSFWGDAGASRYDGMIRPFLLGTEVTLLFFSLSQDNSLQEMINIIEKIKWIDPFMRIILVGSKKGLHSPVKIGSIKISEFIDQHQILHYIEINEKTGENIDKLLAYITDLAVAVCEQKKARSLSIMNYTDYRNSSNEKIVIFASRSASNSMSLLIRTFNDDYSNVGPSYSSRRINKNYNLCFWGHCNSIPYDYRYVHHLEIYGNRISILIFSLYKDNSLQDMINIIEKIKWADPFMHIILVGSKCDLHSPSEISSVEISAFIDRYHIPYYVEINEKTKENIDKLLAYITNFVLAACEQERAMALSGVSSPDYAEGPGDREPGFISKFWRSVMRTTSTAPTSTSNTLPIPNPSNVHTNLLVLGGASGHGSTALTLSLFGDINTLRNDTRPGVVALVGKIDDTHAFLIGDCGHYKHGNRMQLSHLKNANMLLLVFPLSEAASLPALLPVIEAARGANPAMQLLLIGSKSDLSHARQITAADIKAFMAAQGLCYYIETSAKTGDNIPILLEYLTHMALRPEVVIPPCFITATPIELQLSREASAKPGAVLPNTSTASSSSSSSSSVLPPASSVPPGIAMSTCDAAYVAPPTFASASSSSSSSSSSAVPLFEPSSVASSLLPALSSFGTATATSQDTVYADELTQRILTRSLGEDTWSLSVASVHLAIHNQTERETLGETGVQDLLSLLATLRQPFLYIDDTARISLLARYQPTHPAILALSKVIQDLATWRMMQASLPPLLGGAFGALITCYETFLMDLAHGDVEVRARCLTPKAWISGVDIGFHYVALDEGYRLLCTNRYGETVKENATGNHAVASIAGVHYKPNPGGIHAICPNMEHAVSTLHQRFAKNQVAAASSVIKVSGVPIWTIPSPSDEPGQDVLAYQALRTRETNGEKREAILADASLRSRLIMQVAPAQGVLVQAGFTIVGISLVDIVEMQNHLRLFQTRLGQDQAYTLVDTLLGDAQIFMTLGQTHIAAPMPSEDDVPDDVLRQALLDAFLTLSQGMPLHEGLKDFSVSEDKWSEDFRKIYRSVGANALILALGMLHTYPALMAGKSLSKLSRLPRFIHKTLPKLISVRNAACAYEEVLPLWRTLEPRASSELCVGSALGLEADAKFDNFMVELTKDSRGRIIRMRIVAIDSDQAMRLPLLARKATATMPLCVKVEIKNSLFFLDAFMDLPLHPTVMAHLLSQDAIHTIVDWLILLAKRDLACQRWLKSGTVTSQDIHMQYGEVDIPFRLASSAVLYIHHKLVQLQNFLRAYQAEASTSARTLPTHRDILNALFPEIAAYYHHIQTHTDNPRHAEYVVYNGMSWRLVEALSPEEMARPFEERSTPWSVVSPIPFREAYRTLPQFSQFETELGVGVYAMIRALPWHTLTQESQVQCIDKLLSVYPDLTLAPLNLTTTGPALLRIAIAQGVVSTVRWLIDQGVVANTHEEGVASPLLLACAVWSQAPEAMTEILDVLLQAGAHTHLYNPRGYTPILALLSTAQDVQANLVSQAITRLMMASALLDSPEKESGFHPLDKLMGWRNKGARCDGKPRLFAMLVTLGARRVQADKAFAFMQRHQTLPGMQKAYALLCEHHLGIRWHHMQSHMLVNTKPSSSLHTTIVTTQLGRRGYLHPSLVEALLDEKTLTFAPEITRRAQQASVAPEALSHTSQASGSAEALHLRTLQHGVQNTSVPAMPTIRPSTSVALSQVSAEDEVFGRHQVKAVSCNIDGVPMRLHVKARPEFPGVDAAVYDLSQGFVHQGVVPSTLFTLINRLGEPYPVLCSPTVEGMSLYTVLRDPSLAAQVLPNLDEESLSELIVFMMLINQEDGKPDNYIVQAIPEKPGRYRLVAVDNGHAFVLSMFEGKPKVHSIVFCLNAMLASIHPLVRQRILALNPDRWLTHWLQLREAYHTQINQTFNQADVAKLFYGESGLWGWLSRATSSHDTNALPVMLKMPFAEHTITWLYGKVLRLQRALLENETLSHMALFDILEPALCDYYRNTFVNPTPLSRFQAFIAISKGLILSEQGHQTLSTSSDVTTYMGITKEATKALLQDAPRYSAQTALAKLNQVIQQRSRLGEIAQALMRGNPTDFLNLTLDEDKWIVIKRIDWRQITEVDGSPDVARQTRILQALVQSQFSFRRLHLSHCAALTDDIFKGLLRQSRFINHLHIDNCPMLTDNVADIIAVRAKTLQTLHISHQSFSRLPGHNRVLADTPFPELIHATFTHLENLNECVLIAPQLQSLNVSHCPMLVALSLPKTQRLTALNLSHAAIDVTQVQPFINAQAHLQRLDVSHTTLPIETLTLPHTLQHLNLAHTDVSLGRLIQHFYTLGIQAALTSLNLQDCPRLPPHAPAFFHRMLHSRRPFPYLWQQSMEAQQHLVESLQALLSESSPIFTWTDAYQPKRLWWSILTHIPLQCLRFEFMPDANDMVCLQALLHQKTVLQGEPAPECIFAQGKPETQDLGLPTPSHLPMASSTPPAAKLLTIPSKTSPISPHQTSQASSSNSHAHISDTSDSKTSPSRHRVHRPFPYSSTASSSSASSSSGAFYSRASSSSSDALKCSGVDSKPLISMQTVPKKTHVPLASTPSVTTVKSALTQSTKRKALPKLFDSDSDEALFTFPMPEKKPVGLTASQRKTISPRGHLPFDSDSDEALFTFPMPEKKPVSLTAPRPKTASPAYPGLWDASPRGHLPLETLEHDGQPVYSRLQGRGRVT